MINLSEETLEILAKECNRRIHKKYPLLDGPVSGEMVKIILEVIQDIVNSVHGIKELKK